MPSIFKALATSTAWILFVIGLVSLVWMWVDIFARTGGIAGEPYNFSDVAWATFAITSLFLAVVTMKIRKALE